MTSYKSFKSPLLILWLILLNLFALTPISRATPALTKCNITNQKTYVECKNSKSSRYYGVAY
ncbi:MAG: hypothetical protein ACR2IO_03565, partial [Candidatus Nanopelagicus sp.]